MTGWTRAELKSRAKDCLKIYYWPAFAVSLILAIVAGGWGSSAAGSGDQSSYSVGGSIELSMAEILLIFATLMGVILVVVLISAVIQIFIGNILTVGGWRFFMESRAKQESAGVGCIFWAFRSGYYGNVMKIMFLMDVKIILWSLLLIVPGIIKAYEYRMVPLILSENPDMESREAFALSRTMMDGNKWAAFVLDLSFIGWLILAILAGALLTMALPGFLEILAGLPALFVLPYISATEAELYGFLRSRSGRRDLRGYGGPEVVDGSGSWIN